MLIAALECKFKMYCLSILIVKMSFIVQLMTELSEAVIEIYTSNLKIAVMGVICKISTWVCDGLLTDR